MVLHVLLQIVAAMFAWVIAGLATPGVVAGLGYAPAGATFEVPADAFFEAGQKMSARTASPGCPKHKCPEWHRKMVRHRLLAIQR